MGIVFLAALVHAASTRHGRPSTRWAAASSLTRLSVSTSSNQIIVYSLWSAGIAGIISSASLLRTATAGTGYELDVLRWFWAVRVWREKVTLFGTLVGALILSFANGLNLLGVSSYCR